MDYKLIIIIQLLSYGISLFLSNAIINQFRDDEEKFTMLELLNTTFITCVLFGLYLVAATQIDVLLPFTRVAFYGIFYLVFRPDSLMEGIAIIVLSVPIFLGIQYSLHTIY